MKKKDYFERSHKVRRPSLEADNRRMISFEQARIGRIRRGMRETTPNLPPESTPGVCPMRDRDLPLETVKLARCDTREPTCRQREDKLTRPRERASKRGARAPPGCHVESSPLHPARETRRDWSARGAAVYARSTEQKRLSRSALVSVSFGTLCREHRIGRTGTQSLSPPLSPSR